MVKYTIKDIARETGFSISTISRVLNNKKEGVSIESRKKIMEVVEAMNYQPNQFARGLITKKSNMLGLIVPNILNPFFPEICRGIEDKASQLGYSLIICNSDDQPKKEENYLKLLKEKQVDGILLASLNDLTKQNEDYLLTSQIPYILVDRDNEHHAPAGVYFDNFKGGFLAGQHLIEQGHKRIACMTGPPNILSSKRRLKGFLAAMEEFRVPVAESHILAGNYHMEEAYSLAKSFLQKNEVTAIFTSNDLMACGVYQAAYELGISIPKDLSVIGFDNISFGEILNPKLSTIRQDTYEMGAESVNLIVQKIQNETAQSAFFEPTLVLRDSTAKVKEKE